MQFQWLHRSLDDLAGYQFSRLCHYHMGIHWQYQDRVETLVFCLSFAEKHGLINCFLISYVNLKPDQDSVSLSRIAFQNLGIDLKDPSLCLFSY